MVFFIQFNIKRKISSAPTPLPLRFIAFPVPYFENFGWETVGAENDSSFEKEQNIS